MHMTSKLAKLGLFDAKVPRYTSYPTAPQFNADVGGAQMQAWVRSIAPGSQISLYLHIPFCRHLCWFCACRTQGTQSLSPVAGYLKRLRTEIALLGQNLPHGVTLSRMHWGGGTPTLLSPDMIDELAAAITAVTPLAEGAEFSVEVDPKEIDSARVAALARAGMTRASIGVQDFDPEVQTTIGRLQGFEVTRDAAQLLRSAQITSLNADILFGLPHQDTARIATSVQKLLTLNPDRIALYGYAHVPWMARRQSMIPTESLPTPEKRLKLFETAKQLFEWDGYQQIGIDHFAAPHDSLAIAARTGQLRRNFQGYTDDPADVLIGVGASAISRFPQGYAQNAAATSDYARSIDAGRFAVSRGHVFSAEDQLRARIIEAIMCDFYVSYDDIIARFPQASGQIRQLLQNASERFGEMVHLTEDGLRIRQEAQALARIIARHFDAYALSGAGHATAI
ncbi:oxygen-independent coproporphyrinogen III oxidase [uncultured Roseobacter sp.]|uniref:oxygen-independent coproporphyrinogen III oxidase n=1 Tax=uncultured Roseobacter sp. TaxID=114847 RepID=UPI0026088BA6|nr:oxygen-independent coproporphyrinogen III oxidase [uncultured Roseobacter sp.]